MRCFRASLSTDDFDVGAIDVRRCSVVWIARPSFEYATRVVFRNFLDCAQHGDQGNAAGKEPQPLDLLPTVVDATSRVAHVLSEARREAEHASLKAPSRPFTSAAGARRMFSGADYRPSSRPSSVYSESVLV